MVCIPCIVVPVLLFIWHRFLQPIFLRFWNPFGKVEEPKKETEGDKGDVNATAKSCPFSLGGSKLPEGHPIEKDNVDEDEGINETSEMVGAVCAKRTKVEFPDDIEGFGYKFNDDGELRSIKTDTPYEFNVKEDDHSYNQKRYEALGEVITDHIYKLLEEQCKLKRLKVPEDAKAEDAHSFIFASDDALTNEDKLLVLIHGSGVVRAGQWARRLIINNNLNCGTQIPFIERGQREGYGVLVLNTNHNFVTVEGKRRQIQGSETPVEHATYCWEHYISTAKAKQVYIVGHSYGGVVVTTLYKKMKQDFIDRVVAVAFTDSVHFIGSPSGYEPLIKKTINWVASNKPRDTPERRSNCIRALSSGATTHEMTSWSSFDSIFEFFDKRQKQFELNQDEDDGTLCDSPDEYKMPDSPQVIELSDTDSEDDQVQKNDSSPYILSCSDDDESPPTELRNRAKRPAPTELSDSDDLGSSDEANIQSASNDSSNANN